MSTLRGQKYRIVLRTDSGLQLGKIFQVKGMGRTLLGRQIEADVPLEDAKASRTHAIIESQTGGYFLSDLGSTNGTFLNSRPVHTAVRLSLGDEIRIGSTVFKVELFEAAAAKVSPTWRESTRVVLVQGLAAAKAQEAEGAVAQVAVPAPIVKQTRVKTFGRNVEEFLVAAKERRRIMLERHGSWLAGIVLFSLVGLAIWTSVKPSFQTAENSEATLKVISLGK